MIAPDPVIAPDTHKSAAPPKFKVLAPKANDAALLNFKEPASAFILALLDIVIGPAISFEPLILLITPSLLIPVPKIVIGLLINVTLPLTCIALPVFKVSIPVVPKALALLTFKRLLLVDIVIGPVKELLFPVNVNILPVPVPSLVIVPLPVNAPLILTSPSPPIATELVPVAIDVALLNVNKVASEFILDVEAMVIVPDKVLPALVLGTLITPVVFIPVPLIEKYSGMVALLISNLTADPVAIVVLSDPLVPFPKPVAVFKTITPLFTVVIPE